MVGATIAATAFFLSGSNYIATFALSALPAATALAVVFWVRCPPCPAHPEQHRTRVDPSVIVAVQPSRLWPDHNLDHRLWQSYRETCALKGPQLCSRELDAAQYPNVIENGVAASEHPALRAAEAAVRW